MNGLYCAGLTPTSWIVSWTINVPSDPNVVRSRRMASYAEVQSSSANPSVYIPSIPYVRFQSSTCVTYAEAFRLVWNHWDMYGSAERLLSCSAFTNESTLLLLGLGRYGPSHDIPHCLSATVHMITLFTKLHGFAVAARPVYMARHASIEKHSNHWN